MPSAFAHACIGASLTALLPKPLQRPQVVAVLAVLAAAPDLDVIGHRLGVPYSHPLGHRGLSHSIFFAAAVGGCTLPFWRRLSRENAGLLGCLSFVALASHGLLDTLTDAGRGIGLLLPFDGSRYFAPWRPLVTSPLSISAFFAPRGLTVLANEALWLGLPTLLFLGIVSGMLELPRNLFRRIALLGLGTAFVGAGVMHFLNADFFVAIMPPYLPAHRELVYLSGIFEILGGLGVLWPRTRSLAGWGLVALLIAVFPANIHMALHAEQFPDTSQTALYARLPFQFLFIAWAWWATRPDAPKPGGAV